MCAPMAAVAAAQLAVMAVGTVMANRADDARSDAIEEQRRRQVEAEQRQAALQQVRAKRQADVEVSRKRALMGALGISGGEGTAEGILADTMGVFGQEQAVRDEQTTNRLFSINTSATNRQFDIEQRKFGRTMGLITKGVGTLGTAASGMGAGGSSTLSSPTAASGTQNVTSSNTLPSQPAF